MNAMFEDRWRKTLVIAARVRGLDVVPATRFQVAVSHPVVIVRDDGLPDLAPAIVEWLEENCSERWALRFDKRLILAFNDESDETMFRLRFPTIN
jgi:hypothetical protein